MTKTEVKTATERYFELSKYIQEMTAGKLIRETTEQQEARIKRLLKPENYIEFFDFYFGVNSGMSLADAPSSQFHQESYMRLFKDPRIIQFRRWFRGAAKSIHTNVGNLCHLKENNEVNFALLIGKNEGLSKILLSDLQAHLESNELYIKDFGRQVSYGNWAEGHFETLDGRTFKALGLNQPFRGLRIGGNRPDFASVDDVEDRDQAKNKDMVRKFGDKIVGDLMKGFHFKRGRLVIPNNYIVKDGINDYILNKKKDSTHIHVHTVNLSDVNLNPSWPERMTKEDVIEINNDTDYYTSQREDYNNPIEEGKLFKSKDIVKTKIADNQVWDGLLDHWDLSYTSNGDYKAGVLLGIKGMNLYVLEVFCQRCELNSAMETRANWFKKYLAKGYNMMGFFDATAAQQAVFTPIILQTAEDCNCPNLPMPMHQEGDKHNRIAAGITNALFRKILFWSDELSGSDFETFMNQILSFEKGTNANDDAPDTLERAITLSQMFFGFSNNTESTRPMIGKKKSRRL
ncbi:hypothetical protein EGI11_03240 [Chryseobacterium sp. H3056]|uniref:Terminase n=1 Tax=Kaistella daneshvariae TaxID=2487074 RepID=A0A3N0WXH9_9FLAO|nr:hypothetical protein [Kaistella daneshvariae]ROI09786.1 hypothetical protein EGI11_03240 [Kaistella daneshvariae]